MIKLRENIVTKFNVGDIVIYKNKSAGIIKSINGKHCYHVVYYCNNDWANYMDYTGQLTNSKDLSIGSLLDLT